MDVLTVCCLLFAICFGWMGEAKAVSPKIWHENSQKAFEQGEPKDVSLTRDGTVMLSPSWGLAADTGEDFVWALALDAKGALYIGTGNEGRIYILKPGSEKAELLFDLPEIAVFSLAIGSDGAVYAGTSPGGLIYCIVSGKEPVEFCQTGDVHVSTLVARPGGGLYAGTGGDRGRILKIDSRGEVTALYVSKDPNIVSLAAGADGVVYAGTDNSGLVYKVSESGAADVLYDAAENEIHSLAVGKGGVIYATAMAQSSRPEGNGGGKNGGQNGGQNGGGQTGSAIYAIRPSGAAIRLWETDDSMLLDAVSNSDGSVKVVTGKKGRIYQVWPDGRATLLAVLKDKNPWAMIAGGGDVLWIGASGSGEIYRMEGGFAKEGNLTSEPQDFDLVSHWGRVWWQAELPAGTSVAVQTRAGNSEEPDDTWSDWSKLITSPGGQITSRPGRFLQYRLILKTRSGNESPKVRSIQLAGLQENARPRVLRINAESVVAGSEGDDSGESAKGVWKIDWTAGDANDDTLIYHLYFRDVGESRWRLLKDEIQSSQFLWHTEAVPDGAVEVRVVASDRLSNPSELALTDEAISSPFDIDNTAPVVRLGKMQQVGRSVTVTGEIEDARSAISKAAYALNSDDWKVVFPAGRIFDSPLESLDFTIENLKPGSYTLVVRAQDALRNVGVGKTIFEVK